MEPIQDINFANGFSPKNVKISEFNVLEYIEQGKTALVYKAISKCSNESKPEEYAIKIFNDAIFPEK